MNTDTRTGATTNLGGKLKESLGAATGDRTLRGEGKADQLGGKIQQRYGDAKDTLRPVVDQVRRFVRDRPFASAALGGVLGLALINTLRGK